MTVSLTRRDPENRLLARGPRQRLSADMIRDQALAASGLLVEQVGGPSVRPYQPDGLIKDLGGDKEYVQDHGNGLYRRSLYTFWKRTVAPPQMVAFDAGGRETCVVRETRTNTPLQALTLLNDVTFLEAARAVAQVAILQGAEGPEGRVTLAFERILSRGPTRTELDVLLRSYRGHLEEYRANPDAARKLLAVGESPRDERPDPMEHAAMAAVCSLILNLDEAITRE